MKKEKQLTKKEIKTLKDILTKQKEAFLFKEYLSDDYNLQVEDRSDEFDQAQAELDNAHRLRFRNRESFYDKKIMSALKRIDIGEYGKCEECESPISFNRLMARPTAELCIACKEESEKDEFLSISGKQSKSYGKQLDYVSHI